MTVEDIIKLLTIEISKGVKIVEIKEVFNQNKK